MMALSTICKCGNQRHVIMMAISAFARRSATTNIPFCFSCHGHVTIRVKGCRYRNFFFLGSVLELWRLTPHSFALSLLPYRPSFSRWYYHLPNFFDAFCSTNWFLK